MNSAEYVDKLIADQIAAGTPLQDVAWYAALSCVGWAYVFGAWGAYCTPSERQKRYREDHPTIKSACKNFDGKGTCSGCKWFPDGKRTRCFDCRGFTDWTLKAVFGWDMKGEGATSQWNTESNWKAKGTVKDGIPADTLVCLFVKKDDKMSHTGFGMNNETVECSNNVQYSSSRNKKWTHWAVPACVAGDIPAPTPGTDKPTLRRGDRGEYVTLAQTELIQHGYSVGDSGADGVFGANTEKAVKRFQQDNVDESGNALVPDGVIGKKTWWALDQTDIPLYTVTIPHLSKHHAEALVTNYSGAYMTAEERG